MGELELSIEEVQDISFAVPAFQVESKEDMAKDRQVNEVIKKGLNSKGIVDRQQKLAVCHLQLWLDCVDAENQSAHQ